MPRAKTPARAVLSPARRWLLRAVAVVIVPLVFLVVLELALRVAGVGCPVSYFLPAEIEGRKVFIENSRFGLRFFPATVARSPTPTVMPATKAPGTIRVFVLGESAALGDPKPAYGVSRYLEVLLQERYPGRRFEVVCVAMTAINSHAILPIARECARHDGDVWVVYMGNNEMVGPFGAATVFGARAPSLGFIHASVALKATRLGQVVSALGERLRTGAERRPSWGGMGMFLENQVAPDDPLRQVVYGHFRRNLEDIVEAGRRANVPVVLSTVAVNLRDCAPFASTNGAQLLGAMRSDWERHYWTGWAAQTNGQWSAALAAYRQAASLDARHAGLAFWQGVCQLAQGEAALARAMFEQARDLDALPFRVDAPLNAVVAEVAQRRRPDGLRFYDAAVELAKLSRAGIPGEDLFYDHVHLNFDGNYRLALGLAAEVERALGEKLTGAKSETWAGADLCAQRLGLTDWNRDAALAEMLVRLGEPPFRQVAGLTSLAQYCQARLESVRARLKPEAMAPAQALYAEALRHAPNDPRMHANYAEFLEATGRLGDALSEWRRVAELLPHHHAADFWIGRILARQGNTAEARRSFEACLRRRPDLVDAWVELGNLARREGQPTLAIEHYRAALRLQPWNSAVLLQLAHAQAAAGDRASAVSTLRQAVGARPDHWQARYYLGVELATANQISEATIEFAEVVRIKPDFALGHLNLGVAKVRQGQVLEALQQFRETLRLDPQNARAQEYVRLLTKTNEVSP